MGLVILKTDKFCGLQMTPAQFYKRVPILPSNPSISEDQDLDVDDDMVDPDYLPRPQHRSTSPHGPPSKKKCTRPAMEDLHQRKKKRLRTRLLQL